MSGSEPSSNRRFKVVFLGDSGVGKSSIVQYKKSQTFDFQIHATVGHDRLLTQADVNGTPVELLLWDTAGQEKFRALVPLCMRDANIAVIVASLTDFNSMQTMKTVWLEECGKGDPNLKRIGVLNKSDLLPGGKSEGERFADTLRELSDKPFHSVHVVSALNGDGIDELFADIAQTALESTLRDSTEEIKSVVDIAEHPTRRCC